MDGPLRSTQRGLGEPFEIKVYEIDDVERLQRRRGGKVRPPRQAVAVAAPAPQQVPRGNLRRVGPGPRRPPVASNAGAKQERPAAVVPLLLDGSAEVQGSKAGGAGGLPGFSGSSW